MSGITVNLKLDNLSEDERNQFIKLVEKANKKREVWKPKNGDTYHAIDVICTDEIAKHTWKSDLYDDSVYRLGLAYPTKDATELAIKVRETEMELYRYAQEHNEAEIDWNNQNQEKWNVYYNYCSNKIDYDEIYTSKDARAIYFTSQEITRNAVKEIGEERVKQYLMYTG